MGSFFTAEAIAFLGGTLELEMTLQPSRYHWAIALAVLVATIAGSFVAATVDSLGTTPQGSSPFLGGEGATYVGTLTGAVLGATAAGVTAFSVGRRKDQRISAVAGSAVGIVVAAIAGYFSQDMAVAWIHAFQGDPLEGVLVGGALSGALAGAAIAAALRAFRDPPALGRTDVEFAGLLGSILGFLAGMGGGSLGGVLAQAALVCPNGSFENPFTPSGCVAGLLQGAPIFGAWAGAVAGALLSIATAFLLAKIYTRYPPKVPTG